MDINNFIPSQKLYLEVRAGFVTQGTTLTGWCRQHEVNPTNARAALAGIWNGPKGKKLRAELIKASGMSHSSLMPN